MRRSLSSSWWTPLLVCLSFGVGCEACEEFFDGGTPEPPGSGLVGDPCDTASDCRTGLTCAGDNTCQPTGTGTEGAACQLTGDCGDGLYCAASRTCEPSGEGGEGGDCGDTGDCSRGLVCMFEAFGSRCRAAGGSDLGEECSLTTDCLAGLTCVSDGTDVSRCTSPDAFANGDGGVGPPPSLPRWPGETCVVDDGAPRAYFEVPSGDGTDGDFYRLPFPNDVRRTSSGLELSDHPSPGTAVPFDVVGRYVSASETDLDGFATNPVIYFRFSKPHDWGTTENHIRLVDVTPGSPDYGNAANVSWLNTSGPISKYICENWLAMATSPGRPLRPGTTYAAIIDTAITPNPDVGTSFARSPDFDAVMGASTPTDGALAAAWTAYAPLRDWLTDSGGDSSTILNAAVFTTQTVDSVVPALRTAIRGLPAAEVTDLTVCDTGVTSPCDDGTEQRACSPADPSFVELHGRINLPIFQHGTPPYEEPEDGGGLQLDAGGVPQVARMEPVCFALTVPRGATPPAEGFPLVIAGHGTGGSFTGFVRSGLAAAVASGDAAGTPVAAAVLSIDFPQHGERRGGSTRDPSFLFFNFGNPRAARDNITQGSADLLSLVRWATSYDLDAATSPTTEAIHFDPTRIVLHVHSQGATHASLMIPHEPDVSAVVLSGNGGDLTESLLNKTAPIDIAGILPYALLDPDSGGGLTTGGFHPALALFQAFFERVDPVNHARRVYQEPAGGAPGLHVFMTYGPGDSYSPEQTMKAYSIAAGLWQVRPLLTDAWGLREADAPLSGNVTVVDNPFTVGLRQYAPDDPAVDGHFVASRSAAGLSDTTRFVLMALSGQEPPIGAP